MAADLPLPAHSTVRPRAPARARSAALVASKRIDCSLTDSDCFAGASVVQPLDKHALWVTLLGSVRQMNPICRRKNGRSKDRPFADTVSANYLAFPGSPLHSPS